MPLLGVLSSITAKHSVDRTSDESLQNRHNALCVVLLSTYSLSHQNGCIRLMRCGLLQNSRKKYNADSEAPPPWKWFPGDTNSPYKVVTILLQIQTALGSSVPALCIKANASSCASCVSAPCQPEHGLCNLVWLCHTATCRPKPVLLLCQVMPPRRSLQLNTCNHA